VVVTAQVLAAIAEGFALKRTEPQGVPGDLFHRLGYAFSNLGGTVLLFLVVAVVLVSLPVFLERRTSDRQETTVAVTLGLAVVMAIVVGVGSIRASPRPNPATTRARATSTSGAAPSTFASWPDGSTTRSTASCSASSGKAWRRSPPTVAPCSSPTTRAPSRRTRQ